MREGPIYAAAMLAGALAVFTWTILQERRDRVNGTDAESRGVMSDLLSGLRTFFLGDDGLMHEVTSAQSGRYSPIGPWLLGSDVREALTNPTDEQVDAVAAAEYALRMGVSPNGYYRMPRWYREGARLTTRRWLAAAARGNQ